MFVECSDEDMAQTVSNDVRKPSQNCSVLSSFLRALKLRHGVQIQWGQGDLKLQTKLKSKPSADHLMY